MAGDAEGAVNEEAKESLCCSRVFWAGVLCCCTLDNMARKGGDKHIHLQRKGRYKAHTHGPLILYFVKREGRRRATTNFRRRERKRRRKESKKKKKKGKPHQHDLRVSGGNIFARLIVDDDPRNGRKKKIIKNGPSITVEICRLRVSSSSSSSLLILSIFSQCMQSRHVFYFLKTTTPVFSWPRLHSKV